MEHTFSHSGRDTILVFQPSRSYKSPKGTPLAVGVKQTGRIKFKAGAHLGTRKTLDRVQSVFFFPRMRQKVKDHIKACRKCQFTAPIRTNE